MIRVSKENAVALRKVSGMPITCMEWSRAGWILTGSLDGRVTSLIDDALSPSATAELDSPILCIAAQRGGHLFAVGTKSGRLIFFDVRKSRYRVGDLPQFEPVFVKSFAAPIRSARFDNSGKFLVVGTQRPSVHIFSVDDSWNSSKVHDKPLITPEFQMPVALTSTERKDAVVISSLTKSRLHRSKFEAIKGNHLRRALKPPHIEFSAENVEREFLQLNNWILSATLSPDGAVLAYGTAVDGVIFYDWRACRRLFGSDELEKLKFNRSKIDRNFRVPTVVFESQQHSAYYASGKYLRKLHF